MDSLLINIKLGLDSYHVLKVGMIPDVQLGRLEFYLFSFFSSNLIALIRLALMLMGMNLETLLHCKV